MTLLSTSEACRELPDSAVIALAVKGEMAAMEELVRRQQGKVRQFMYRLCHHRDEADDLAQKVFLRMWRALPQLRSVDAFYGWQKQLMVNTWKESIRKPEIATSDDEISEVGATHNEAPYLSKDLEWALAQLPAEKRLCLVLAYQDGFTHSEIAELSGLAEGTVKSHIARGGKTLKELLSPYAEDKK